MLVVGWEVEVLDVGWEVEVLDVGREAEKAADKAVELWAHMRATRLTEQPAGRFGLVLLSLTCAQPASSCAPCPACARHSC